MYSISYNEISRLLEGRGAVIEVVNAVMNRHADFTDACEDENLYGERADIVAEREIAVQFLKRFGWNVKYHN